MRRFVQQPCNRKRRRAIPILVAKARKRALASILAVRFGSTNRGFDCNQPLAAAVARECGCTGLGAYHGVFEKAFGLILAGDEMLNIIYYRCDQLLAKAVINCQV